MGPHIHLIMLFINPERFRGYLVIGGGKAAGAGTGDSANRPLQSERPRMYQVAMAVASAVVA